MEPTKIELNLSTSGKAIPRPPSSSSGHSGSSPSQSIGDASHRLKSPLSKTSQGSPGQSPSRQLTPHRLVDLQDEGYTGYSSPSQHLSALDAVTLGTGPIDPDPWATREATVAMSNAATQLATAVTDIQRSLQTAITNQTGALIGYFEIKTREDRESQRESQEKFRNALAHDISDAADKVADAMGQSIKLMREHGMSDAADKVADAMTTAGKAGGASQGSEGNVDQQVDRGDEETLQRESQNIESPFGEGGGGGSVSLPEVDNLANAPTPIPPGDPFVAVEVREGGIRGTVSYTQNFFVLVHDRHVLSLGLQGRCSFERGGIAKPALFLQFDTRAAAQAYSPLMADGRGSSARVEVRCCDYGVQLERGRISPMEEGVYHFTRCGFVLPGLRGRDGNTGISVRRFLPSPIKGIPGFDPRLKLQQGSIEPYLLYIENQGLTGGVGIGPLRGSFQLWDQWYVPNIRLLVNLIGGQRVDDRKVAPIFEVSSKTQDAQDLNREQIQLLNQKVERVVSEVSQIGRQQKIAFFGDAPSLIQRLQGRRERKGVIRQIEELGVSARSERQEIRNKVQQGFQESEMCCTRHDAQLKQIDKRLYQGIEPVKNAPRLFGIAHNLQGIVFLVTFLAIVLAIASLSRFSLPLLKALKAAFEARGRRGGGDTRQDLNDSNESNSND